VGYLNASKVLTTGTALTFDGTNLTVPAEVYRNSATSYIRIAGGDTAAAGANVLIFGQTHATAPGRAVIGASGTGYAQLATAGGSATLDSSGNLGLGVTPSAWASGWPALQIGTGAAVWSTSDGRVSIAANLYVGAGPAARYISNGFGSSYSQIAGVHTWSFAQNNTSGAGASVSPTTYMTLTAAGNLGIGTPIPSRKLQVNGSLYAGPGLSTGGIQIQESIGPFNDNSPRTFSDPCNSSFSVIYISSNVGLTSIPVYSNGGAGMAWNFTALTPGTGTWTNGAGLSISFTQAGTGGNTYTVSISGANGIITITRTAGSLPYTAYLQLLATI
jgi:hypothetical protein